MFIERFIKKVYISFYKDENYKFLCEIKKNKKLIESIKEEFDSKEKLNEKINELMDDYPQTFISTIINSINQGVIPSCNKSEFKKREIEIENIKSICIKNKYSIFVSIYDLVNIKKEYPFEIDFLYSIFAPIDFFAKKRNNYLYVLILKENIALLAYKNEIPIFSDIFEIKEEKNEEVEEDIELLEDIDLEEEIAEDIEEEAEILDFEDEENEPASLELTSIEHNIIQYLKDAIKDYYENYSDDFLEKIIFLDTINIGKNLKKLTEDELLLENEIINFDLLKTLNNISESENV